LDLNQKDNDFDAFMGIINSHIESERDNYKTKLGAVDYSDTAKIDQIVDEANISAASIKERIAIPSMG
jgi:hypothetical protein